MPRARLVVPFGFEGAADRAARAFARALGGVEDCIDIENVPGEGGRAGVRRANALAADARSPVLLLATPSTHLLLPRRLGAAQALSGEFAPALGLGSAPNVLLVAPKLGVRSVAELVARARDGDLVYASAGAGQTIHLCTALFCEMAGVAMRHRPFDAGSVHAYAGLVAGNVHVYFDNLLGCRDRVASGDALALAISAPVRSAHLPAVPTLAECGFPGHSLEVWFGIFAAHPDPANATRLQALPGDVALRERLATLGLEGGVTGAAALAARIADSAASWTRALEAASRQG